MRTIKFRGKSLTTGEWLVGSHFNDSGEDYIIPQNILDIHDYENFQVDQNTIGEFTGIRDARDRDIYEDDIIRIDGFRERGFLRVVFYEGSFALATPRESKLLDSGSHPLLNDYGRLPELGCFELQGFYVIRGNIHDHPEMMEE